MTYYSPDSPDQTRATCEPTAEPSKLDSNAGSADAVNTAATTEEESAENAVTPIPAKKAAIAAFTFPFSPSVFAPSQSDDQSWHQKGNQSAHHKTPSRTPNGSRRSMGKR